MIRKIRVDTFKLNITWNFILQVASNLELSTEWQKKQNIDVIS